MIGTKTKMASKVTILPRMMQKETNLMIFFFILELHIPKLKAG